MYQPRLDPSRGLTQPSPRKAKPKTEVRRAHENGTRTTPSSSPLDALAEGLISVGERFAKRRSNFRIP
jgi:hypothetical protein